MAPSIKENKFSFNYGIKGYMFAAPFTISSTNLSFHFHSSFIPSINSHSSSLFNKGRTAKAAGMEIDGINWNGMVLRQRSLRLITNNKSKEEGRLVQSTHPSTNNQSIPPN